MDDELNAVIIEYKRPRESDRDALLQLMKYYGWFVSDENHMKYLREYIAKTKPEILEQGGEINDIRLIAVVGELSDDVKNACYAVYPDIEVIVYKTFRWGDDIGILPQIVFEAAAEVKREIKPPKTLEEHFKNKEQMRSLFDTLEKKLRESISPDIKIKPTQQYINIFTKEDGPAFLGVWIYKDYIKLECRAILDDPRFKPWTRDSAWGKPGQGGSVEIRSAQEINDKIIGWIRESYRNKVSE